MKIVSGPDVVRVAIGIAQGLGNGTLPPTNRLCGAYWNIEDHFLLAFEDELREHYQERCRFVERLNAIILPVIRSWHENRSQSWDYPVPHPTLSEQRAYHEVEDKWADDPYGDAHRRLCLHIAQELASRRAKRRWFHWFSR
ncbi:hypothetical protein [Propionivibrio soli]|uniref:hypothetical protein n=1 Tax=Propionivibrio soli TaxID=2976531 RepID=UPI0021E74BDB|nr:hypothetical protein [Propionivibrio soli]